MKPSINWTPGPGDPTLLHGVLGSLLIEIDFHPHRWSEGNPLFDLTVYRNGSQMIERQFNLWQDLIEWLTTHDKTLTDWMKP